MKSGVDEGPFGEQIVWWGAERPLCGQGERAWPVQPSDSSQRTLFFSTSRRKVCKVGGHLWIPLKSPFTQVMCC